MVLREVLAGRDFDQVERVSFSTESEAMAKAEEMAKIKGLTVDILFFLKGWQDWKDVCFHQPVGA